MAIVKVYADMNKKYAEIMLKAEAAQLKVAAQAFTDCTKYCKLDTGKLMRSGRVELSDGTMTWSAPYARCAYYTGTPNRSKNPKASLMWAHKAARLNGVKWKQIVEKELL